MEKVEILYHRIQQNMFEKSLEDLGIFSKQYLHTLIHPMYSNNAHMPTYCIISMDFNNLNDINQSEGRAKGDKIIHDSLALYLDNLPKGYLCARSGGDEFIIILPQTLEETIQIMQDKQQLLQNHKQDLLNISIATQAIDSGTCFNLQEMMDKNEVTIHRLKQNCCTTLFENGTQQGYWNCLEQKLEANFDSFFKSLRLHGKPLNSTDMPHIHADLLQAFKQSLQTCNLPTLKKPKVYKEASYQDLATQMHHILTNPVSSPKVLNDVSVSDYASILDKLLRQRNTNYFTKDYFKDYLLGERAGSYYAILGSTNNVKLANEAYGFKHTDKEIAELADQFKQQGEKLLKAPFCNAAYYKGPANYLCDCSGGDFIMATNKPSSSNLAFEDSIITAEGCLCQLCLTDTPRLLNAYNFEDIFRTMHAEVDAKKDALVFDFLKASPTEDKNTSEKRIAILQNFLSQTIQYYSHHISDYDNSYQMMKFCLLADRQIYTALGKFNLKQETMLSLPNGPSL